MKFRTPKQTPELQYALAAVLSIAPTIFTALRFRARIVKRSGFQMDDWLIVVSLFFVYLTSIFLVLGMCVSTDIKTLFLIDVGTALGYQGQHMRIGPQGPDIADEKYIWFLKVTTLVISLQKFY